jgi:xanthine dehydrogenase accessory factor
MKEILSIIDAYKFLAKSGDYGVLASVVYTQGSTYRAPGARALILPDNEIIGLVGGGCLEVDLLAQARSVRETGNPRLVHYDSTSDGDVIWGLGLGCAGVVDVLLERVGIDWPGPLSFLEKCMRERKTGVLATVIHSGGDGSIPLGVRWMRAADGFSETMGSWEPPTYLNTLASGVLNEAKGRMIQDGTTEILMERIVPPLRLVIYGAGADAIPVVRFALELGWRVEVFDDRPNYARAERFPGASTVSRCAPETVSDSVELDLGTAVLIMTHNYLQDRTVLKYVLPSTACYVGILGPKKRTDKLLEDLQKDGHDLSEDQRDRLYSPSGLDIGAETPEQIALSIVSEIQAHVSDRQGGPLRKRVGPIHDRVVSLRSEAPLHEANF